MEVPNQTGSRKEFFLVALALAGLLFILLWPSFQENVIVFSNDGPLGVNYSDATKNPEEFKGLWWDSGWVGRMLHASPHLSSLFKLVVGPIGYAKFHPFVSLWVLGMSAWFLGKQLRFHPGVRFMMGVGAAFNSNGLSNMAWGQASRPMALAAAFMALSAIYSSQFRYRWVKMILAGLAVGWGVSEGFDVGALFSICIAIFAVVFSFVTAQSIPKKIGLAAGRVALLAIFAGLMAAQTIGGIVESQLKKSGDSAEEVMSEEQRWTFMTDLSTPKLETLGVVIPGLFGYATTTPGTKQYWGNQSRFNGSGEYAGVLVAIFALAAVAFSFRKNERYLDATSRKLIWFWAGLGLICLLLAYGKYAPFYQLVYHLPFFSSMRNPMKFMHAFHLCLLVLFGYGLQITYRSYMQGAVNRAATLKLHLKKWWSSVPVFEKRFTISLVVAVTVSLLSWLIYSSSQKDIVGAIQAIGVDPARASAMASQSIGAFGWFVGVLIVSAVLLVMVLSGWFSGKNARTGLIILAVVLTVDLVRANTPWFIFHDYTRKYALNPIVELLRDRPYEKRVDIMPFQPPEMQMLYGLFATEWAQHHFPFYNIHTTHIVQDPRPQPDDAAFRKAMGQSVDTLFRKWELTSTRYVFWLAGPFVDAIHQQFPAAKGRFKVHTTFDIVPKSDVKQGQPMTFEDLTAVINPNGKFALLEFTGALPKVKLFSSWQVIPDTKEALEKLASPDFDPHTSVVLQESVPIAPTPSADAGTAQITSYAPKHMELSIEAKTPAVLLLNDKYHPDWKVWIDGKPAKLMRGNYIMRAVVVEPGKHTVVFKFEPSLRNLYLTISAICLGVLLSGYLFVMTRRKDTTDKDATASAAQSTQKTV